MAASKTSLSAGAIFRHVLLEDPAVTKLTKHIYPIVADNAELPYICYRRAGQTVAPQKAGQPGADTIQMEVLCCASSYSDSIELAEAVRAALDYTQAEFSGLFMRSCYLNGSEEDYEGDAYIQTLAFTIKV